MVLSEIDWKVKLDKRKDKEETIIDASIICSSPTKNSEWKCEAAARIDVHASTTQKLTKTHIPTTEFGSSRLTSEAVEVIRTMDLREYMQNKLTTFDIRLGVNPVFHILPDSHHSHLFAGKFFINVNVNQLPFTSNDTELSGTTWNVNAVKKDDHLGVYLYHKNARNNPNWSWNVKCSFKLFSNNANVHPIIKTIYKKFSLGLRHWGFPDFITWDSLVNPVTKYVQSDTMYMEIYLEVEQPTPLWDIRATRSTNMLCSICLQDIQSPAATKCGHIFCMDCIRESVQQNKKCPCCNEAADSEEIRRIFI